MNTDQLLSQSVIDKSLFSRLRSNSNHMKWFICFSKNFVIASISFKSLILPHNQTTSVSYSYSILLEKPGASISVFNAKCSYRAWLAPLKIYSKHFSFFLMKIFWKWYFFEFYFLPIRVYFFILLFQYLFLDLTRWNALIGI